LENKLYFLKKVQVDTHILIKMLEGESGFEKAKYYIPVPYMAGAQFM